MGAHGRFGEAGDPVLDAALDAVITIDEEGRVVEFNRTSEKIFGYPRSIALGAAVADLIIPARLRDAYRDGLASVAAGGASQLLGRRIELSAVRADGNEIPVELRLTRTSEAPPRFTAWIRDLSEQKHREAQHTRRTALLDRAERLAEIGSWEWNLDTDELLWSDNLFRLFGREAGEVTPTLDFVFQQGDPVDTERLKRELDLARHTGTLPAIDYRIVRPDGAVRHLRATTATVRQEKGEPRRIVGSVQDFTERRRAEHEIAAHCAVAEALEEWDTLDQGAERLLRKLADALGCVAGALWLPHDQLLINRVFWPRGSAELSAFEQATETLRLPRGVGLLGRVWEAREPVNHTCAFDDHDFRRREAAGQAGIRGAVALPALNSEEVLAVLEFYSREEEERSERLMRSLTGIGYALGQFLSHRRGELRPSSLTPRELEVLQLAARGLSGREIAEELVIASSTVKTHFEHIYAKLGVSDRPAAVAEAMREGLID